MTQSVLFFGKIIRDIRILKKSNWNANVTEKRFQLTKNGALLVLVEKHATIPGMKFTKFLTLLELLLCQKQFYVT